MAKILVTGGAGFIGSHLCDFLLGKGYHVIAMDNLLTGKIQNIEHLAGEERFEFIKQDVTEYIYVSGHIDYILHFASPASPIDYLEYPIQTLKVGALGTHKTLGLAKEKGATFLLASTSEVYGDPIEHPQNEDYWGNVNPIGPRGVYDEAKRFAEALVMAYHRFHNVETRIARIFNTYGPRMRINDGRVVPTFINQSLKKEQLTVCGDGSQTRSFCFIEDLVQGLYKLMKSSFTDPVNLGNPDEMTINRFAEIVLEYTGSESGVINKPLPEDDPKIRQPNIDLAKKILDWEPKVSLETGLLRTIQWFKEQGIS